MLRSLVIGVFFLCLGLHGQAQFGVSTSYMSLDATTWKSTLNRLNNPVDDLFDSQIKIGIDYWFRLKNTRVEFLPTISIAMGSSNSPATNFFRPDKKQTVGFHVNTHFYIFDFMGDCDCPTWSKEGNFFTKGFFVNLAPGLSFHRFTSDIGENQGFNNPVSTDLKFDGALGVGLDIGINDFLTITPFFNYIVRPRVSYDSFLSLANNLGVEIETRDNLYQYEFGVRFGFRPDYGR